MEESRPRPDDTPPGTIVAGRFRILAELGRGGMARVHRAQDLTTGRDVALKLLKPEIAEHAEAMERFRREAEFLAGLKHPAIVGVEAFGKLPDGRLYLAMELLVGETLGARIRRGKLSAEAISPILAGAAVGLDAAHRAGVVHRDLKPDNIFLVLTEGGDVAQVKLLDFGISKIDGRQSLTQTGQILGTPRYMAPEQLAGDRDVDGRADVYALGVIVYEALAGQPAFPVSHPADLIVAIIHGRATPLRALRPDVSAELEAVVGRSMARARDARYTSATELAQAWFEVVHGDTAHAGVRTGAGTRLMGAMDATGKEERADEPRADDLPFRPATFREFEAQQAKGGQSTVQLAEFSPRELSKSAADMQAVQQPAPAQRAAPAAMAAPAPMAQPVAPRPAPAKPAQPDLRTPSDRGSNRAKEQMMPAMPMAGFGVTPVSPPVVAVAPAPVPAQAAPPQQPVPAAQNPASASRRAPTPQHATPLDEPSIALPTRRFPFVPILIGLVVLGSCIAGGFGVSALYRRFAARETGAATAPMPEPQPIAPPPSPHGATGPLTVVPELPALNLPDASVTPTAPPSTPPTPPPSTPTTTTTTMQTPTPAMTDTPPTMETARVDASTGMQTVTATPTTMENTHDGTATPPPWSGDQTGGSDETPAQLVQRAKDAFRAGNARECVSLATEALSRGADATTYALRGDCYRALGDNSRALRSYQRFCQLAPSHPRVATVRTTAESLGGTCP
jgi:hypothetical protein